MECPVCNKEINRHLHIIKSKDKSHQNYVESQYEIGKKYLFDGMTISKIREVDEIFIKSAVEAYLYQNYKDKIRENASNSRSKNISKAKTKDDTPKKKRRREIEEMIKNGVENIDYVICKECGLASTQISKHVYNKHGLNKEEYQFKYHGAELFCANLKENNRKMMLENNPNDNPESIDKMMNTKAKTKPERSRKAKEAFVSGKRVASHNAGKGIGGFRPDLGHYVRSMWEANVARFLNLKNIKYEYEPEAVAFYDKNGELIESYLPDFYLPKYDVYIEVKGQMDDLSLKKINLFKQQSKRLIIIEEKMYDWLYRRYKKKLKKRLEYGKRNVKTHPQYFK